MPRRLVRRSHRHRCRKCGARVNGGGVCPGCVELSADALERIERERRETVKRLRRKLDPGCLALRAANIEPNRAWQRERGQT